MIILGSRVVTKNNLNKIISKKRKDGFYKSRKPKMTDFDYLFLSKSEIPFLHKRYLTVYENEKGKQYCVFSNNIPKPGDKDFSRVEDLVGATTGYNTKVVSCEICYVLG